MSAKKTSAKAPAAKKSAARKATGKTAGAKTGAKAAAAKAAPADAPSGAGTPGPAAPDARAAGHAGRALRDPSTRHFPIQMFASVLGLGGLGVAWREAAEAFAFTAVPGDVVLGFTAGFYIAVTALYALKAARHPDTVLDDFVDPVRGTYFAAAGMGLLLLAVAALPHARWLAEGLWAVGTPVNLVITLALVSTWMARSVRITHATPVWFLPIAGNLLAPIAGASLGFLDISWMVFAVGLVLWLVLLVIVINRLIFHEPMEQPLRPTIAIMLAPPALASISYAVLAGGYFDGIATMLFGVALFTAALLAVRAPALMRLPFALSNWSYTFPLAAFSVAATLFADQRAHMASDALAIASLAAVTVTTLWVFAVTVRALVRGALFRADAAAGEDRTDDG